VTPAIVGRQSRARRISALTWICVAAALFLLFPSAVRAQAKSILTVDADVQAFAISQDNRIVYAVPRLKRVKKNVIERDDIWIATPNGGKRRIVEGEKFMPIPPLSTYVVNSLAWSPDGRRIAMDIATQTAGEEEETPQAVKAIALLDDNGQEIRVAGSKTRFIENASRGVWLTDDATVVYLSGTGPFQIVRLRPSDGTSTTLFEGHTFDVVTWDTQRDRAFAVGGNLSLSGRLALVQLDLVHETVQEVSRLGGYEGELTISPSGRKVAYFVDGDTIEVRDLANPAKAARVRAGMGKFEWGKDEQHILLKRGRESKSNALVWVGVYDGTFVPALHDLLFNDFEISPSAESLAITQPGKRVLMVYRLE
jgi:hypothetical protein